MLDLGKLVGCIKKFGLYAEVVEQEKNNGVIKHAIVVSENDASKVRLSFRADIFDQEGQEEDLAEEIVFHFWENMDRFPLNGAGSEFQRDILLQGLELAVARKAWNPGRNPVRPAGETDLVFYLSCRMGGYRVKVTPAVLEMAGVSEEEAFCAAKENTIKGTLVSTIGDMLKTMGLPVEGAPDMIVVSNVERTYGAAAGLLPGVLESARRKMGVEVIQVIPSSIHEVLYVPYMADMDAQKMIQEVNAMSCVPDDEILSDHPYFWDGKTLSNQA